MYKSVVLKKYVIIDVTVIYNWKTIPYKDFIESSLFGSYKPQRSLSKYIRVVIGSVDTSDDDIPPMTKPK